MSYSNAFGGPPTPSPPPTPTQADPPSTPTQTVPSPTPTQTVPSPTPTQTDPSPDSYNSDDLQEVSLKDDDNDNSKNSEPTDQPKKKSKILPKLGYFFIGSLLLFCVVTLIIVVFLGMQTGLPERKFPDAEVQNLKIEETLKNFKSNVKVYQSSELEPAGALTESDSGKVLIFPDGGTGRLITLPPPIIPGINYDVRFSTAGPTGESIGTSFQTGNSNYLLIGSAAIGASIGQGGKGTSTNIHNAVAADKFTVFNPFGTGGGGQVYTYQANFVSTGASWYVTSQIAVDGDKNKVLTTPFFIS